MQSQALLLLKRRSVLLSLSTLVMTTLAQGVMAAVTNIQINQQSGQTFITWSEVANSDFYHIYRSTTPILDETGLDSAVKVGTVDNTSSQNKRLQEIGGSNSPELEPAYFYRIIDGGQYLTDEDGLFVYTISEDTTVDSYYAVTVETNEIENRSIVLGTNATIEPEKEIRGFPQPVLQLDDVTINNHVVDVFSHWLVAEGQGTLFYPPMASPDVIKYNYPAASTFAVRVQGEGNNLPLLINLHAGGGNFSKSLGGTGEDEIVLAMGNIIKNNWDTGKDYQNLYWYGYHENYNPMASGTDAVPTGGTVQDYERRRVFWTIEWVKRHYNADSNRVYLKGGSQGGVGASFMAAKYPDLFAAVFTIAAMYDFGLHQGIDENIYDDSSSPGWSWNPDTSKRAGAGAHLWGDFEFAHLPSNDGASVYDTSLYLNHFLNTAGVQQNFPYFITFFGTNDKTVNWKYKPATIDYMVNQMKMGVQAFWAPGNHQETLNAGSSSIYEWAPISGASSALHQFSKDQSYLVFSNASTNDAIGDGTLTNFVLTNGAQVGTINGHLSWDRSSITDRSDTYRVTITASDLDILTGTGEHKVNLPGTTDITVRQTQDFPIAEGITYRWANFSLTNGIIQNGFITVDADNLLTIHGFKLESDGNELIIRVQ